MTKQTLGLIGVGAFGALAARHLAAHIDLVLHDPAVDLTDLARITGARIGTLAEAAACMIVILAVPVQKIENIVRSITPSLRPDALVIDVGSVKIKPMAAMRAILPPGVSCVGTHPLFGPQSGKNGIAGLKIAVCEGRGGRSGEVIAFCRDKLDLKVIACTAEQHDRDMAYVHGLTHMIGKVIVALDLPRFELTTKTWDLIDQAIGFIRHDSDELFHAIERENPFAAEAKQKFFAAARALEERLSQTHNRDSGND